MKIFGIQITRDHFFNRQSVERYQVHAYSYGKADERAKIVAWLRDSEEFYVNHYEARELAQYIEAGEHLK